MEPLEEKVCSLERDLKDGLGSIRKAVQEHQLHITEEITDFKRDASEKLISNKYEITQLLQTENYNARAEANKLAVQLKSEVNLGMTSIHTELKEKIEDAKREKDKCEEDLRIFVKQANEELTKTFDEKIKQRSLAFYAVSGFIFIIFSILSTITFTTSSKVDTVETNVQDQIASFRTELQTFKGEIREQLALELGKVNSSLEKIQLLLSMHEDTNPKRLKSMLDQMKKLGSPGLQEVP